MHRRTGRAGAIAVAFALSAIGGLTASPRARAASHTYTSPGFTYTGAKPTKVSTPPPPAKLVTLGDGADPHVLVDAAGTGQIAYTTAPDYGTEALARDCVLLRGHGGCQSNAALAPPASDPAASIDDDGPTPLTIGNELVLLSHRYPELETLPDGSTGSPTYLWTSDDGGASFTGPGIAGNAQVSGNAVVWGGASPQIAWISDTETGGTFFQSAAAGAFSGQQLNLGDSGPDQAYDGRLAVDGTLPIAAFQDLSDHIFVREYSGSGDIYDTANWSRAQIAGGGYSQIVSGPSGVWVLFQRPSDQALMVQKIVGGQPAGSPVKVLSDRQYSHAYYVINQDASGGMTLAFISGDDSDQISVVTSDNGRDWSAPALIAEHVKDPSRLSIGAAADGGGFVAFQVPSASTSHSSIDVAEFGTLAATGQTGLGNLDGGGAGGLGGDPNATASCSDVHFGDIDAITQDGGCFLRDLSDPRSGAVVAQGEIRLNGLQIIPDAGASIVIDPRAHVIKSYGEVKVVLRAPGLGDITLYHGALSLQLSANLADAGQQLFDFHVSAATSSLFGFGFEGDIDVQIAKDGSVQIPVSLRLPDYMGGESAQALLRADNAHGLEVSTLHLGVDDLDLGALEIKDLAIDYSDAQSKWTGTATLFVPGGSPFFEIHADVEFDNGDFTMGSFQAGVGFPGIPIYTDTYFTGFGGGFDIHPGKRHFYGSADFGAIPTGDQYGIGVNGNVSVTFYDNGPVKVVVNGSGTVEGQQIANGQLVFQTNGVFQVTGGVDINLDVAEYTADLNADVDLPAKQFSASLTGELKVFDHDLADAKGVISSKGAGACVGYLGLYAGFTYAWGGRVDPILGTSCDFSSFILAPVSLQPDALTGHASPGASVQIAPHTMATDIAVTGAGGPPSVVLVDPRGQTVVPQVLSATTAHADAVSASSTGGDQTVVLLRAPRAGRWQVQAAPGSPAITQIASARGNPTPKISATVSGTGTTRTLHYRTDAGPGLTTTFEEKSAHAYQTIGSASGHRGTLHFTPASGPAGSRAIVAVVTADGLPRERTVVGHYRAPAPARPGAVKGLRVSEHGAAFHVRFGAASGAAHYVVRLTGDDGRHLTRIIARGAHRITVPAQGYADALAVTVSGVSAYGKVGPAGGAHATYTSRVVARARRAATRGGHRGRRATHRAGRGTHHHRHH